jgi:magnesium chelatase family protein
MLVEECPMLATIASATLLGVVGSPVRVEVHVSAGLPGFSIVGLPDASCREARDRVRAALLSTELTWPQRRVTVNLAPTGVRKSGAGLDLAIAIGVLVADEQLPATCVADVGFIGELGLDGSIRPVPGSLPLVDALDTGTAVVPPPSAVEAQLVGRHVVRAVGTLAELLASLVGDDPWPALPCPDDLPPLPDHPDLADVRGQPVARFALEVAAAGGHHLLMSGPPGAGKTMLARRLPGLLPALEHDDAMVTTRVHSAAGVALPPGGLVRRPPFRAPHHGASSVAMVGGGGARMQPGEISIATNGVLFLDELAEFHADVLDSLRQPLEEGVVRVARASYRTTFPARFQLVAAMNPCPCGDGGVPGGCRCGGHAMARYARRLSGPLVDRFDLRIPVSRPDPHLLVGGAPGESSAVVAERVLEARARAAARGVRSNSDLQSSDLELHAPLTSEAGDQLEQLLRTGRLSARGLQRVRRVALTLADLCGDPAPLGTGHLETAIGLRCEPMATITRLAG